MDFCAGFQPTAMACMRHDQHEELLECSLESNELRAAKFDLLLTAASKLLIPGSDINGDEGMRSDALRCIRKGSGGLGS